LTKATYLVEFPARALPNAEENAEEVAGHVQIGTRTLGRAEADADVKSARGELARGELTGVELNGVELTGVELNGVGSLPDSIGSGEPFAMPRQGVDGTLLAVVPIPGTGTSLAIVGYPVTASGSMVALGSIPAGGVPASSVQVGPVQVGTVPGGTVPAGPISIGALTAGQLVGERPGLLLDHEQRRVWVDGSEIPLTFQEFELLAFLSAHPTTVFSRADLVRQVWQRDFAADSRTVDVHVSRLRHKLGPAYARCLVTEYRVGYQFRPAVG
jgi:hypothetical protein